MMGTTVSRELGNGTLRSIELHRAMPYSVTNPPDEIDAFHNFDTFILAIAVTADAEKTFDFVLEPKTEDECTIPVSLFLFAADP